MFLTRGYVQHHDTWELWFKDVQGALPLSAMQVLCFLTWCLYIDPGPLCNFHRKHKHIQSQSNLCGLPSYAAFAAC